MNPFKGLTPIQTFGAATLIVIFIIALVFPN